MKKYLVLDNLGVTHTVFAAGYHWRDESYAVFYVKGDVVFEVYLPKVITLAEKEKVDSETESITYAGAVGVSQE